MPFGIIGRTGPGMRQVVGFGDRSTGRGIFGGNLGLQERTRDKLIIVLLKQKNFGVPGRCCAGFIELAYSHVIVAQTTYLAVKNVCSFTVIVCSRDGYTARGVVEMVQHLQLVDSDIAASNFSNELIQ